MPADLPAAVFVVLHIAATGTSVLPQILERASALEVLPARDGAAIGPGCVVVAPPDRHLVVERDAEDVVRMRLTRGPRENATVRRSTRCCARWPASSARGAAGLSSPATVPTHSSACRRSSTRAPSRAPKSAGTLTTAP